MGKLLELLKKNKNDIIKPVIVLLGICIVIPFALAVTNAVTVGRIAMLEEQKSQEAMKSLIAADNFAEAEFGEENAFVYYKALRDSEPVGYIFTTKAKGYGGEVSVMTAVNPDGTVKAVAILDISNETPGLGQNAAKEDFYSQFKGKKTDIELLKSGADGEKNQVDAVTGATITSRAVTNAVNEALEQFKTVSMTWSVIPEGEVAVIEE